MAVISGGCHNRCDGEHETVIVHSNNNGAGVFPRHRRSGNPVKPGRFSVRSSRIYTPILRSCTPY